MQINYDSNSNQDDRVQKKSRLHGSEPEEDFVFYVVFEEGLAICIHNPISAKFSVNATSTVKGHSRSTLQFFHVCTVQSSRVLACFDCL